MMMRRAVAVAALCMLWACTSTSPQPPSPEPQASRTEVEIVGDDLGEAAAATVLAMIEPTPAMLKAALRDDPDAMRDAAETSLLACQAASTCPAQFGSCSSWSTPAVCAESCGPGVCFCRPIRDCPGEPPEPRGQRTTNSFRVCFNPAGQACTEWAASTTTFCGC